MYSLFQNLFGSSVAEVPVEVAQVEPEKIEEWVILSDDLDTMKEDVNVPVHPQPESIRIDTRNRKKQIQKRKGKDLMTKVTRPNYSADIRSEMTFRGTSRKTAKKNQKQFNKKGTIFLHIHTYICNTYIEYVM
jgi:hypothetical protein